MSRKTVKAVDPEAERLLALFKEIAHAACSARPPFPKAGGTHVRQVVSCPTYSGNAPMHRRR